MAPGRSPGAHSESSEREIEIVGDDDQVLGGQMVPVDDLADGVAAEVHIGLRGDEDELLAAEDALDDLGAKPLLDRGRARDSGQAVDHHEPDVVACPRVLPPRVP